MLCGAVHRGSIGQSEADSLINALAAVGFDGLQGREGSAQVTTEDLCGSRPVSALGFGPFGPGFVKIVNDDFAVRGEFASVPQEGGDGAAEVLEGLDGFGGGCGLHEVASPAQAVESVDSPIQNSRQLSQQAVA